MSNKPETSETAADARHSTPALGSWSDEWDDSDDYYEEEDYMDDADCGMITDDKGRPEGCTMAGSEYCDFVCPHRNSLYRDDSTNRVMSSSTQKQKS